MYSLAIKRPVVSSHSFSVSSTQRQSEGMVKIYPYNLWLSYGLRTYGRAFFTLIRIFYQFHYLFFSLTLSTADHIPTDKNNLPYVQLTVIVML